MKKVLNAIVIVILLVIIVGGLGYIGYNAFFMNHEGAAHTFPNTNNTMPHQTKPNPPSSTDSTPGQPPQNNMNHQQMESNNSQNPVGPGAVSIPSVYAKYNFTVQNKEALDKAIQQIQEASKNITMDPYSLNQTQAGTQPPSQQSQNPETVDSNTQQGNTVINIYPSVSPNSSQPGIADSKDGAASYDINKMQQIHSGLYNLAVGTQLLQILSNELGNQMIETSVKIENPAQYYAGLYNFSLQNKASLTSALNYINQTPGLADINPYINSNGYVYNQERMNQIHTNINKLAQGIVGLNKLNDDFVKQSILQYTEAQNAYANNQTSQPDHNLHGTSIFDNVNASQVITLILVTMVILFIIGFIGYLISLLRRQEPVQRTDTQRL